MKLNAVGFIETNSIARGIAAADAALKAAQVKLHFARPNCPGKYNFLVSGEVAAVQAAINASVISAGSTIVEKLVIPRIHPNVVKAINMTAGVMDLNAVGIVEYFSITSAILGADNAVKAADVELIDVRLGTGIGGKSYIVLCGDTAAVEQAVANASQDANEQGMLIAKTVIPSPMPELFEHLL